jgi:predicted ATP-dependent serine protease
MMNHPEVMHFECDECGAVLSRYEVEEGRCVECNAKNTAIAVFFPVSDPQPARFHDAD